MTTTSPAPLDALTRHFTDLRDATVREWPLNVAEPAHAEELVPLLRAIAGADIHHLVFQVGGDWCIIPALHPAEMRQSA